MRIGMVTDFGDAERGIRRHFTARSFGRPSKNAHISDHCGRRPGWPASLWSERHSITRGKIVNSNYTIATARFVGQSVLSLHGEVAYL